MNAAPTSPGNWITAVSLFLGPVLGPFSLLVFSAIIGALLSMSKAEIDSKLEGLKFLTVSVAVSLVLSGLAQWVVSTYTRIPADVALMPVAFFLAAGRPFLMGAIQKVVSAIADFIAALLAKRG